ncbi:MAG: type II secretion system protein GspK [Planctomycetaceae bacterium]
MKSRAQSVQQTSSRRGFILAIVTIVVVLLSLAAYNYSDTMIVEHQASAMGGRDVAARMAAESAIELVATRIMEHDADDSINLYNDPDTFRGHLIMDSAVSRGRVLSSVLAFDETATGVVRFGLASENSKFNLNSLLAIAQSEDDLPEEEQLGLEYLAMQSIPNMTDDIVDAILDWLDSDDDRRPGGAESADYETLSVSYSCKNGPMETIEELLKVQGVTPALFYGEDANHNGMEDIGEDTNTDGIFDLGWQAYLTVSSRERNTNPDGDAKIDLNMGQMTKLYDAVEELYGEEAASFVCAFRLGGTDYVTAQTSNLPQLTVDGTISRNDIDFTVVPAYRFNSIYDLIGGETGSVKMLTGVDQSFTSPWGEDAATLLDVFPDLEKNFSVTDDTAIEGRININQARREVLLTLQPAMTEVAADSIISARPAADLESASSGILARRNTAAWILAEGIVDLETLRQLGPYITVGGDVYRFQALGHFEEGGPTTRLEAEVDASEYPPAVRFVRDLTSLGRGYRTDTFLPAQNQNR